MQEATIELSWLDLEDGCSLFECHVNLFELGKVLYCEVFNFVGGRLLFNRGGLQLFVQKAKVLEFVEGRLFLDNILLGGFDGLGFAMSEEIFRIVEK
jgi:hypothetical protein